jgi:hypothetical protein
MEGGVIATKFEWRSYKSCLFRAALAVVLAFAAVMAVVSFSPGVQASTLHAVRVVVCPTKSGASPGAPSKNASTLEVVLPADIVGKVSIYTDQYGLQSVLGPRGWRCIASYGADGNGGVTIYQKGETVHFFSDVAKGSKTLRAINSDWSPACVACILGQSCPFFAAAKASVASFGYTSSEVSCRRPKGELILGSGHAIVYFSDPPGVVGTGEPSGGKLRALGLAVWEGLVKKGGRTITNGSAIVTCTLPASDAQLCHASFSWFERHDAHKLTT